MDLDDFSDDGLDDLPDNALQELENQAIQFTQAPGPGPGRPQPGPNEESQEVSAYGWDEDDDLDTAEVTNVNGIPVTRPPVTEKTLPQSNVRLEQQTRKTVPPPINPRWNPTIDPSSRIASAGLASRPRAPGQIPLPTQSMYGSQRLSSQAPGGMQRPQHSQFARPAIPSRPPLSQHSAHPSGDIVSALQQRVRALEGDLNAARGEISIIRSNTTKAQQQHDVEVSRLKKLNADQMAKQERIAEAAVAAEKTANTELQFLQRDMREASDRSRRNVTTGASGGAGSATPKKTAKNWGFADGFDEMDMAASPSKGQGRHRNGTSVAANVGERTPSKGKRKRPIVDSPVMALETHTGDVVMGDDRPTSDVVHQPVVLVAPTPPFEFLPLVLDHGCFHEQPPTFDTLSRFFFPSEPNVSFAAIIFQRLPLMGNYHRPMQLLVDFSELIINIWIRCLEEHLWEPVKYLVALITFTFDLHVISVAPWLVTKLVSVTQATISTLAEGRFRVPDGDISKSEEYRVLGQHIDVRSVMSLLYMTSMACATYTEASGPDSLASSFWRLVSLDFVMLLLSPKQKLDDVMDMLEFLASSSLPDSLGPIMEERDPVFVARLVIERVSAKLTEFPRSAATADQKRKIRITALRTLITFARYPFGAMQLASHDNALPRLVTCLSSSIDDLYDQSIPSNIFHPSAEDTSLPLMQETSSAKLYSIISQSVFLLHTLVTDRQTANVVDINQKLSTSHGGSQRYLLALGRLTFAEEDLVIEAGIESETVEMAHELLEMAVTPDEGEIISEAFGA